MKQNKINEFLWSCAGVDKNILRLYPNEYAKYAGSGGTILFTAIMATISGGYALFFVFNNIIISILFAIFWGFLIFNLDRFIVNSMHTDGKDTLSIKKIKAALPRFIMAIFLGIVISTPLEMKIFNDRIETQLLKDNIEKINETKSKLQDYKTLTLLQTEQTTLSNERKQLSNELQKALKELKEEAEGNALSGIAGHGNIYKDKEIYVSQCLQRLNEWDNLHNERLLTLLTRIEETNLKIYIFESKIDNLREDGFSARYEAFSNLKDNNKSLAIVSFMITMLFIIIEITPTFFKLIMVSGPYEEHILNNNYIVHTDIIKLLNNIDTELKIQITNNQQKLLEITKQQESETITYSTPLNNKKQLIIKQQEPEEVPYKLKSNTSITTVKKKQLIIGSSKNKHGLLVLNFTAKNNKINI